MNDAGGANKDDVVNEVERPWWLDHLPLLLTLMAGIFVTIRILGAANFNLNTAYGILQSSGTVAVLLGALLSSIGLFSLAIAAICVINLGLPYLQNPRHRLERQAATATAITFGIVALLTLEVRFYVLLLLLLLVLVVLYLVIAYVLGPLWSWSRAKQREPEQAQGWAPDPEVLRRIDEKKGREQRFSRWWRWVVLGVVPLSAVFLPIWLPPEALSIANSRPITAYVLSDTSNGYTVLVADTGKLEYLDRSRVEARHVCSFPNASVFQPLPSLFSPKPDYPPCPK